VKLRGLVAAVVTVGALAVAAPASAAPAKIDFCKATAQYFFETKNKPHHIVAKFYIYCNQRPKWTNTKVQIEYWNPEGGSRHDGAWEAAKSMPEGYPPRSILIHANGLPRAKGTKHYQLESRCAVGADMSLHIFGDSGAPDGKVTKFNFRTFVGVYC
jgi:hypothetical protein